MLYWETKQGEGVGVGTRTARARGAALGTVLVCLLALALILLTAVSAGISHLRMSTSATAQQHARNLADAALAQALSDLVASDFSAPTVPTLVVSIPDLPDATGTVTYDSGTPGFSKGYSTFNLNQDSATVGARGRQVPGRTVHLVARGKVGEVESWMECYYYKPPFPDGLAATGRVTASSLYLAGVRRTQGYAGGDPSTINPAEAFPANLFSNFSQAGPPVAVLSDNCRITGSAGAVGGVSVDASSIVEGEVLPGSDPRALPELDVRDKITTLEGQAVPVTFPLASNWFVRSGPLDVPGELDLNGSILLVRGDLTVDGAIKGTGAILVEGDVTITDGRTEVSASDQVAIACTGNFTLSAEQPDGNYFQGLVYSEGDLQARDITVFGATVVNGKGGAEGSATLENVRYVYNPGSVQTTVFKPLVFKKTYGGFDPGDGYAAVFLSVRRAPDGKRWLCNMTTYLSATTRASDESDPRRPPTSMPAARWFDDFHVPAGNQNEFATRTWADFLIPAAEPADPVDQSVIAPVITQMVGEWVGTDMLNHSPTERTAWTNTARAAALPYFSNPGPTTTVTFNLNTLLAELMGSSRILLWRPFK